MTVNVGVLGLGFMGRTHLRAYRAAAAAGFPCRVAGAAPLETSESGSEAAGRGNIALAGGPTDLGDVRVHETADALAADPGIDLVSVCTPTDTHVALAAQMLRAGKHVLVEKPVALRSADVLVLAAEAEQARRLCMPAMCMRFWPGWDWLKARVQDGRFGAVRSASFTRLGSRPGWSPEFYRNPDRCGGAHFDLHLHDTDVIVWLFGMPAEVSSRGSIDHVTTTYSFADGPAHVAAEGGWFESGGFPFRMRYTVEFDGAVADWNIARPDPLHITRGGHTTPEPLPALTGYDGEIREIVSAVASGATSTGTDLRGAAAVISVLEAELESLRSGRPAPCA